MLLFFSDYNINPSSSPSPSRSPSTPLIRKTKRHYVTGRGDDLATVKAAAWAWYQRNEGKPVRDFGLIRDRVISRPTRYKIEAMRNNVSSENRVFTECKVSRSLGFSNPQVCESHKERINHSKKMIDYFHQNSFPVGPDDLINHCDQKNENLCDGKNKVSKGKLLKGILLRPMVVCSRYADVETNAFLKKIPAAGFRRRM